MGKTPPDPDLEQWLSLMMLSWHARYSRHPASAYQLVRALMKDSYVAYRRSLSGDRRQHHECAIEVQGNEVAGADQQVDALEAQSKKA
jgi:hypothetical protein